MSILLAIETSSREYSIALGRDRQLRYNSAHQQTGCCSTDIAALISDGLESIGAEVSDISAITLNIGPGGLSYVRSGVSFANALSFSLGIQIYPFNTFEILGCEVVRHTTLPLLYVVPAANGTGYVGVVDGPAVRMMRFGPLDSAVAQAINGIAEVAIAGGIRERVAALLPEVKTVDTGIDRPDVSVLLEMCYRAWDRGSQPVPHVSPLTEQASVFYEQA